MMALNTSGWHTKRTRQQQGDGRCFSCARTVLSRGEMKRVVCLCHELSTDKRLHALVTVGRTHDGCLLDHKVGVNEHGQSIEALDGRVRDRVSMAMVMMCDIALT